MISMLICDSRKKELQEIQDISKNLAARYSEEKWEFHNIGNAEELKQYVDLKPLLDMICLDVTMTEALSHAEQLRKLNIHSYMVVIADMHISPMSYMKPNIMAGSLLLRPFSQKQLWQVLGEAFQSFCRKAFETDEHQVFIVENKESRNLVPYHQVIYYEAREKKVYVNTSTKELSFYSTLDKLEQLLPRQFIRCHRSYIINIEKITRIAYAQNLIILEQEIEIPVSRSYKSHFRKMEALLEERLYDGR